MTTGDATRQALLRRGFVLEYLTLAWNVLGVAVLTVAAISARSVALAGFGLDSLVTRSPIPAATSTATAMSMPTGQAY